ncbi:MAG: SpoVA/SpoVAEb family sporulation membrane protein, partial [Clostridia bacterium]
MVFLPFYGTRVMRAFTVLFIFACFAIIKLSQNVKGIEFMHYFWAFAVGGMFCVIGQLLMDFTKLTPARILVIYVVGGVLLSAIGIYEPLAKFAGAGATV